MRQPQHKKQYGQHFLQDDNTAEKICNKLQLKGEHYSHLLEIGAGSGILTRHLVDNNHLPLSIVEVDEHWAKYLKGQFPVVQERIYQTDILSFDLHEFGAGLGQFGVIGNFPYNIASQITLKILDNRFYIPEMVGMFQLEVARRLAAKPGGKDYGLLTVILQSFYNVEQCFKIPPGAFRPSPKVQSGVIRIVRKSTFPQDIKYELFFSIVKTAFQQRRKKMSNALKAHQSAIEAIDPALLDKRPEDVNPEAFQAITRQIMDDNKR